MKKAILVLAFLATIALSVLATLYFVGYFEESPDNPFIQKQRKEYRPHLRRKERVVLGEFQ